MPFISNKTLTYSIIGFNVDVSALEMSITVQSKIENKLFETVTHTVPKADLQVLMGNTLSPDENVYAGVQRLLFNYLLDKQLIDGSFE